MPPNNKPLGQNDSNEQPFRADDGSVELDISHNDAAVNNQPTPTATPVPTPNPRPPLPPPQHHVPLPEQPVVPPQPSLPPQAPQVPEPTPTPRSLPPTPPQPPMPQSPGRQKPAWQQDLLPATKPAQQSPVNQLAQPQPNPASQPTPNHQLPPQPQPLPPPPTEPPKTPDQQLTEPKGPKPKSKLLPRLIIAGASILGAIIIGLLLWQFVFNKTSYQPPQYNELTAYSQDTAPEGTRFSIEYPSVMQLQSASEDQALLEDVVPQDKQSRVGLVQLSTINIRRVETNKLAQNGQLQFLDTVLSDARDGELQGVTGGQVSNLFVSDFEPDPSGQKYTASVSYDIIPDGSNEDSFKSFQGRLLVAFGKKHAYILLVQAESSAWQQNESVWTSVIDSFKYDQ